MAALWVGFLADDFVGAIFLQGNGFHLVISELLGKGGQFLRPLSFFFFWAEGTLFDLNPVLLHAVHLILFVGVGLLAAGVASRLAGQRAAAWALLLVLWYPAHAEVLLWIAAIFDLLAAIFVLVGLLNALPDERGNGRRQAILDTFVIGLLAPLAKEVGWAFPIVLTMWWIMGLLPAAPRGVARKIVTAGWAGAFLSVLYRLVTLGGLGGYPHTITRLFQGLSVLPALALHAAFLPANPSFGGWSIGINIACAGGALALAGVGITHARKGSPGARLIAAGLSLAIATLLPVLPYLSIAAYWRESRYLTLPGIGLALAAAGCATAAIGFRRLAAAALVSSWLAALVLATIPWLQAAKARDVLLDAIRASTSAPGPHTVWVEGPIGDVHGAQFLGGHLSWAVRYELPGRTIDAESAWNQHLMGRKPSPPCQHSTAHCHLFRFQVDPLEVSEIQSLAVSTRGRPRRGPRFRNEFSLCNCKGGPGRACQDCRPGVGRGIPPPHRYDPPCSQSGQACRGKCCVRWMAVDGSSTRVANTGNIDQLHWHELSPHETVGS